MKSTVLHRAYTGAQKPQAPQMQPKEKRRLSEHFADAVAKGLSSWKFVMGQAIVLAAWITLNTAPVSPVNPWDPNLTLLNLALSSQAAFAASFILISQNRRARKDRELVENDYMIDLKTSADIKELHRKLDIVMAAMPIQKASETVVHTAPKVVIRATK